MVNLLTTVISQPAGRKWRDPWQYDRKSYATPRRVNFLLCSAM